MDATPARSNEWTLRDVTLTFGDVPKLMGIVNVTPDSFSDGGKFYDAGVAIEHALRLAEEGADILDIGGESTRPYSDPVSAYEEFRRVIPVVREVVRQTQVPVSIDTSKASVAQAAVEAGAQIINDVTGLQGDPLMLETAERLQVGVCAMHMQGTPQTMQDEPTYTDVVGEILEYLRGRRDQLLSSGIEPSRICLDPGIGFGKTHEHNITLMQSCDVFHQIGCPILVGHSRKGFIAKLMGDKEADRTAATLGGTIRLAEQGVQVIRIHDVLAARQALTVFAACGGLKHLELRNGMEKRE